jgi:hypothetical protein
MNRLSPMALILCSVVLFIGICSEFFPLANAASQPNPLFEKYYQEWQTYKAAHFVKGKYTLVYVPQSIDIIAPDGSCNINGTLLPNGCSVGSLIVSAATYNNLTTNPAIMAIPPNDIQPTQGTPTTSYCQIANWIILNEDGYFSNIENVTALVDPPYCGGIIPSPEFNFPAIAFVIGTLSIIAISSFGMRRMKL